MNNSEIKHRGAVIIGAGDMAGKSVFHSQLKESGVDYVVVDDINDIPLSEEMSKRFNSFIDEKKFVIKAQPTFPKTKIFEIGVRKIEKGNYITGKRLPKRKKK